MSTDRFRKMLEGMGAGPDTVKQAVKFHPHAKRGTKAGSGHELRAELSTALDPACGLIASEYLNNGEISIQMAQSASCLTKLQFRKAYTTVKAALTKMGVLDKFHDARQATIQVLLREYILQPALESKLRRHCLSLQNGLGYSVTQLRQNDIVCGIFLWVCGAARVPNLPTADTLASEYQFEATLLRAFLAKLTKQFAAFKKEISQDARSQASSPTKAIVPAGRASARKQPQRPILCKDNKLSRPAAATEEEQEPTPAKRRRLDSGSAQQLFEATIRASSSKATLDAPRPISPPATEPPEDVEMVDAADAPSSSESEDDENARRGETARRFRPVYLQREQWTSRDPRLKSVKFWRMREAQKQEFLERLGRPFEMSSAR